MLVIFSMDNMGSVTARPARQDIQEQYAEHMQQFLPNDDGSAFLQEHHAHDLQGMIPDRRFKELMDGYTVTCRMDSYDYGMLLGYDASELNIRG